MSEKVNANRRAISHSRGFSLMDLIIAMFMFAIVSLIAAPRLSALYDSINKRNAEVLILQDVRLAQAKSVEQGCRGIFAIATNGKSYTFGCDYVPYSTTTVADQIIYTRNLPSKITMTADAQVLFNTRGQVVDVNEALQTRTLSLKSSRTGTAVTFNTGTLRPTGFFTYSN